MSSERILGNQKENITLFIQQKINDRIQTKVYTNKMIGHYVMPVLVGALEYCVAQGLTENKVLVTTN